MVWANSQFATYYMVCVGVFRFHSDGHNPVGRRLIMDE